MPNAAANALLIAHLMLRFLARFLANGRKERYAKRSGAPIPKPKLEPKDPARTVAGPKDTAVDDVIEQTFTGARLVNNKLSVFAFTCASNAHVKRTGL